jgi:hypothetical protein
MASRIAEPTLLASGPLPLIVPRSLFGAVVAAAVASGCYAGGGGTAPPPNTFYFPVGLAVSHAADFVTPDGVRHAGLGGNALYAVNSDFDLQWNGGTIQVYDLFLLRRDADRLINANLVEGAAMPSHCPKDAPDCIPFLSPWVQTSPDASGTCLDPSLLSSSPVEANGTRVPLGEACAPAVDSTPYERDSFTIGAFATQLQLTPDGSRLFAPVRGDSSLTWADVAPDDPNTFPPGDVAAPDGGAGSAPEGGPDGGAGSAPEGGPDGGSGAPDGGPGGPVPWTRSMTPFDDSPDPFHIECRPDANGQCTTRAGNVVDPGDSRGMTLPGEPFGMAMTPDGTAVVITHQTTTNTSLLLTGCDLIASTAAVDVGVDAGQGAPGTSTCHPSAIESTPSMQFVLGGTATPSNPGATAPPVGGLPSGGSGIAAIPHDSTPYSPAPGCEYFPTNYVGPCVRPAFLETNHSTPEIDLIRYYDDLGSSLQRPFLVKEAAFPLTANATGTDQRGIVIDPTPRMECRYRAMASNGGTLAPGDDARCGTVPHRVFIASRTPASLIVGQVGGVSADGTTFDPDLLVITGNRPLASGPSNVYLAPIVDETGKYELRVFIVCFDSSQIFVYDPDSDSVENVINVGPGPFAMAFDPFDLEQVAQHMAVPNDTRQVNGAGKPPGTTLTGPTLKTYRFAYVASFTQSFVQMIDLDDSLPMISPYTFENVVFTLGQPTPPKGS